MPVISIKQLLEAGVHFGHQTKRWNPKMAKFIYGKRNGIYIIDLQKTVKKLKEACDFVKEAAGKGGYVLLVGTKSQAQEIVTEEAKRCGMFYVSYRWLGGMLTNFKTIKKSIKRLEDLEKMKANDTFSKFTKKEVGGFEKEMAKLNKVLGGIRNMDRLPAVVYVVDTKKEHTAILEAKRLEIPVIGIADTNSDPDEVDYVIPGNDDAIRSIKLVTYLISESVLEGKRGVAEEAMAAEKAAEDAAAAAAGEGVPVVAVADLPADIDEQLETEMKKFEEGKIGLKKKPAKGGIE